MRQIKQVITGFELARYKVVGAHVDVEGRNIRGVTLPRLGNDTTKDTA